MILFQCVPHARLGNQLFHLAALDKLCSGGEIGILLACDDLHRYFHWRRRGIFITRRGGRRISRILQELADVGLASHHMERQIQTEFGVIDSGELVPPRTMRSPLTVVQQAFLQSDCWVRDDFAEMLVFRKPILQAVHAFAGEKCIDFDTAIFVHVRRGDYLEWKILRAGTPSLPGDYFREGIQRLQSKMSVRKIVFVTDDPQYVETEFVDITNKIVVSRTTIFDLCLMSRCASGVMSASSYSWWGAMLGPRRVAPVAPQYWLGWKRRIASPAKILSERFDSITVESEWAEAPQAASNGDFALP